MIFESQIVYALVLLATGIAVGFFCGLLGVGGGFLMVPVQIWLLSLQGIESTLATRIAFATSLAVVLPTAISGCRGHSCWGVVLWQEGVIIGLFGMLGGFLGGSIASHAPGELLRMIFGIIIMLAAARMLLLPRLEPKQEPHNRPKKSIIQYMIWGLAVGVLSGLTGIGGGLMLIPIMIIALGFSLYQAIGTSSLAIAFNALGGIMAYAINGWGVQGLPAYCVGYIDLFQFALLAGSSIFAAPRGANLAHRLPAERLKQIFVILMLYIGLKMIGAAEWLGL
jgi:uncharacterized membrane protein YfcA